MSSGSKKKEPRYARLSEAKASHSQRMWAEVSFSAPKKSITHNTMHTGILILIYVRHDLLHASVKYVAIFRELKKTKDECIENLY